MAENKIYCPNHPTVEMKKNDGFFALTSLNKNKEKITFLPATGIPIVVYTCSVCGKIELYVAQTDPKWDRL